MGLTTEGDDAVSTGAALDEDSCAVLEHRASVDLAAARLLPSTAVPSPASYAIDSAGTILWADDGFAELARSHGQTDLADTAVGRPLTSFIAGDRPRQLQGRLVERARRSDGPLELRYRCDAPALRRHAVLRVEAQPEGGVVFTTWFDGVETCPHQPLLDPRLRRGDDVVRLCAWCNRFEIGGWREVEEAAGDLALTDLPRVEHDVCAICEMLLATRPAGGPTRSGPHDLP